MIMMMERAGDLGDAHWRQEWQVCNNEHFFSAMIIYFYPYYMIKSVGR
jgi:hypothetical protein